MNTLSHFDPVCIVDFTLHLFNKLQFTLYLCLIIRLIVYPITAEKFLLTVLARVVR